MQLSTNPWIIDVVSDAIIFDGAMPHTQMEYIEYTDSSHSVEVQDRYNRPIAYLKGTPDLRTVRTGRMGWVYGVKVPPVNSFGQPNLQSGRLILYFE